MMSEYLLNLLQFNELEKYVGSILKFSGLGQQQLSHMYMCDLLYVAVFKNIVY